MIVQWLFDLNAQLQGWLTAQFPTDWTVPDFFANLDDTVNSVLSNLNNVGVWVDWPVVIGCVSAVVLTWVATAAIKLIRAIASYIPFFGGAG